MTPQATSRILQINLDFAQLCARRDQTEQCTTKVVIQVERIVIVVCRNGLDLLWRVQKKMVVGGI